MDYQEKLVQLESKRKGIYTRVYFSIIIVVSIIIIGIINDRFQIIVFGGIVGLLISVGIVSDAVSKYKKAFKNELMPLIIAKTGLDLKYDYKDGVGQKTVMGSYLFKKPDRYYCEDLIYGTIDDVRFMASDVHMQEKHVEIDSRGHHHIEYITYFKGRWFVYDFNKEFNGIIQVREDGLFQGLPWGIKAEKIKLEDIEFNKKFKTYATNQHDAFYVLTPTLMVNMKKLESRYPGRIFFSFIGSTLHIAMYNSKDAFEPPIVSPIDDSFINNQVQEIKLLQDIVNELKLNRNIFK